MTYIGLLNPARFKKIVTTLVALSLTSALFLYGFSSPAFAGATLYLSPASKSVKVNQSFTVAIRVNTGGDKVNTVQANVSYPTDKLNYVSVSYSASSFEIKAQESVSGGLIKIARGTLSPVKGDKLIATLTFKASKTGTAKVNFAAKSKVVDSDTNTPITPLSTAGGTYTISSSTKPPPPPPPDPDGTKPPPSGNGNISTPTSTPTATKKDTTPPKISGLKVSNLGFEKATISWITNEKATSVVEYGIAKTLGIIKYNTRLKTSHSITLAKEILTPGTRFFYQVSSKDAAGNVAKSKLTSFKTKGYGVKLRVLNLAGEPLDGAKITIVPDFDTVVADKGGFAIFVDVAPGRHSVNIEIGDQKLAETIVVKETKDPNKVQLFEIKVAAAATPQGSDFLSNTYLIIISIIAIAIVGLVWFGRSYLLATRRAGGGKADVIVDGQPEEPKRPPEPSIPQKSQGPPKPPSGAKPSGGSKPLMPKNEPKIEVIRWNKK
jgi:hypothetical protein